MRTPFALACTAAMVMGLGVFDAEHPPDDVDVRNILPINYLNVNLCVDQELQISKQVRLYVAL